MPRGIAWILFCQTFRPFPLFPRGCSFLLSVPLLFQLLRHSTCHRSVTPAGRCLSDIRKEQATLSCAAIQGQIAVRGIELHFLSVPRGLFRVSAASISSILPSRRGHAGCSPPSLPFRESEEPACPIVTSSPFTATMTA